MDRPQFPDHHDCEGLTGITLDHLPRDESLGRVLAKFGTRDGRRDLVALSVSHNELAQMAGMSRSHVTVTMGRLRRRGLVRYQREGPLRVDVPALTVYLGRTLGET